MTDIAEDANGQGYTVTARHWEPKNYVQAMKEKSFQKKRKESNSAIEPAMLIGGAAGFALGAVLMQKVLPFALGAHPAHAATIQLMLQNPLAVYGGCVVLCLIAAFTARAVHNSSSGGGKFSGPQSCMDIPAVGDNGRMVTVDEMKVGGSGSASVMQGETVEVESIRTSYIVNAAGCYSVSELLL